MRGNKKFTAMILIVLLLSTVFILAGCPRPRPTGVNEIVLGTTTLPNGDFSGMFFSSAYDGQVPELTQDYSPLCLPRIKSTRSIEALL